MESRHFYILFVSFFAGIFLASVYEFGVSLVFAVLVFLALALLSINDRRIFWLVCILFFSLGVWRLEISKTDVHLLDSDVGKSISVVGTVSNEPENKENAQRFRFKPFHSEDKMIVSAPLYPRFSYGDVLSMTGELKFPENFESYPGGPEFDYVSYLKKDGVRYLLEKPQIISLGENQGSILMTGLIRLKSSFMGNIERLMGEPHSSLVAGILLGEKGSLPKELQEDFRRTGLTHILVLSGSNVSLVAASLINVFSYFPRALAQSAASFSIVLFALMTGAGATTVRASIMALIVILAKRSGRDYDVSRALVAAAFLMLWHNPFILAFDIGFQLSFISTLAIIYVSPLFAERLSWVTERFQFREIVSTTISTQVFILPFMLYKMGEVSVISLATNLLVLPFVPWSMFTGFMTGVTGFIGNIGMPVAWATHVMLSWVVFVVSSFADFPFAQTRLSIGEPLMIAAYVFYALSIWRLRRRSSSLRSAS